MVGVKTMTRLVVQWDDINQDNQQFKLVKRGNITVPSIAASSVDPFDIDFPGNAKIQSLDDVPPSATQPVLVGETLIPFLFVNDGLQHVQVKQSPYYIFRREQYWRREHYYKHNGGSAVTKTITLERGLTQNDAVTIETITSIQISANAGFNYKGITATIAGQVSKSLKVSSTSSTTVMTKRTETISRTYPAGSEFAEAQWVLVDRYTILRTDKSQVIEWEVLLNDNVYEDKKVSVESESSLLGINLIFSIVLYPEIFTITVAEVFE